MLFNQKINLILKHSINVETYTCQRTKIYIIYVYVCDKWLEGSVNLIICAYLENILYEKSIFGI